MYLLHHRKEEFLLTIQTLKLQVSKYQTENHVPHLIASPEQYTQDFHKNYTFFNLVKSVLKVQNQRVLSFRFSR